MGRAPCCEKMGLKKGPWTKEEDHMLISYINQHGHGNWRALPKHAGLLRCGKSCRLRWTNYLRPDIKRGNFSKDEEDTIIKLHQALGNRWSAIASKLPGRTDNEIKNVWHTHLKKRLKQAVSEPETIQEQDKVDLQDPKLSCPVKISSATTTIQAQDDNNNNNQSSPPHSSSNDTSSTTTILDKPTRMCLISENYPELDHDFWLDVVSSGDQSGETNQSIHDSAVSPVLHAVDHGNGFNPSTHDDLDIWCDLFTKNTEEIYDLLEF